MERMTKLDGSDHTDLDAQIQRELDALGNETLEVEDNIKDYDETFLDSGLQQVTDLTIINYCISSVFTHNDTFDICPGTPSIANLQ